jgi:hypothetical protein
MIGNLEHVSDLSRKPQRWMYCITTGSGGIWRLAQISGTAAMHAGPIKLQLLHDFKQCMSLTGLHDFASLMGVSSMVEGRAQN